MILDSSAIIAILLREPRFEALLDKLASASNPGVGAPTLTETGIVLAAKIGSDSKRIVLAFLAEASLAIVPFGEQHWRASIDAYQRYGKGRHLAALNFGDCMTYATAKLARQPLLCTGSDFAKTDLQIA